MAKPQKFEKDRIEKARQSLLSQIFRGNNTFTGREAVKQLLGPLIAAHENGLSFEEIADIFKKDGLELTASTLRSYYFNMKNKDELAREAHRHADKVIKTKASIEKCLLDAHNERGHEIAIEYAKKLFERTMSYTDLNQTHDSKKNNVRAAIDIPRIKVAEKQTNSSIAKTIEEIEKVSLATDDRTILEEDLLVKDNKVFFASGKAFEGYLSKKQIHLLRSVGKIVAPTSGRSSKEFVSMPTKL